MAFINQDKTVSEYPLYSSIKSSGSSEHIDVIWPRTSREEAIFKQGQLHQLSHFNWYCAGIGFCVSSLFWALMVYISG